MYKCDLFLQTKQMIKNKLSATLVVEINGVLNFFLKSQLLESFILTRRNLVHTAV